jgi:hypothetical protein
MAPKWNKTPKKKDISLETYGINPWMGDWPVARPLPTQTTQSQQIHNTYIYPRRGFDTMVPILARQQALQASDNTATVIGTYRPTCPKLSCIQPRAKTPHKGLTHFKLQWSIDYTVLHTDIIFLEAQRRFFLDKL